MTGLRWVFEGASGDAAFAALCRALSGLRAFARAVQPAGLAARPGLAELRGLRDGRPAAPRPAVQRAPTLPGAAALEELRRQAAQRRARLAAAIAQWCPDTGKRN